MEIIYFPRLSLPDEGWVNPALLYFDKINVISPRGYDRSIFDRKTLELVDEGMVFQAMPPYDSGDSDKSSRFIEYINKLPRNERTDTELSRIHLGKLSDSKLSDYLINCGLLVESKKYWLEGPNWLVVRIMAYLALQLSERRDTHTPLITDQDADYHMMIGRNAKLSEKNKRLRALTQLLPISSQINPREIGNFRRKFSSELSLFRSFIEDLIVETSDEIKSDFEKKLWEAEIVRAELERALEKNKIGEQSIENIMLIGTALASIAEGSLISTGVAVASLAYSAGLNMRKERRSKILHRKPLVYAALLSRIS